MSQPVHRHDRRPTPPAVETDGAPCDLTPEDDVWLSEPSASLDVSWVEDDLENTPAGELLASDPVPGTVPRAPELAYTPPPGHRRGTPAPAALRRPVIERVRPREELRAAAVATRATPEKRLPASPRAAVARPSLAAVALLYGGAIATGIASAALVLFFAR